MSSKIETLKTKVSNASADVEKKARELMEVKSKIIRMKAELEKARQKRGYQLSNRELYEVEKQIRELESQIYNCETEELLKKGAELDDAKAALKEAEYEYDAVKVAEVMKDLKPLIAEYNNKSRELAGLVEAIYKKFYSMPPEIRNCAPGTHRENIHKLPTFNLPSRISTCPVTAEQQPETLFSLRQFAKKLTGIDDAANWGPELHFYEPPKQNW